MHTHLKNFGEGRLATRKEICTNHLHTNGDLNNISSRNSINMLHLNPKILPEYAKWRNMLKTFPLNFTVKFSSL